MYTYCFIWICWAGCWTYNHFIWNTQFARATWNASGKEKVDHKGMPEEFLYDIKEYCILLLFGKICLLKSSRFCVVWRHSFRGVIIFQIPWSMQDTY